MKLGEDGAGVKREGVTVKVGSAASSRGQSFKEASQNMNAVRSGTFKFDLADDRVIVAQCYLHDAWRRPLRKVRMKPLGGRNVLGPQDQSPALAGTRVPPNSPGCRAAGAWPATPPQAVPAVQVRCRPGTQGLRHGTQVRLLRAH